MESNDIASIDYAFWLINFLKDRSIVQLAFFHIRAVVKSIYPMLLRYERNINV